MINLENENIISITPVGSRVTCVPAPTDTDQDYLVLIKEGASNKITLDLIINKYTLDGKKEGYESEDNIFNSWKKDDINLIVTEDKEFAEKFLIATKIAKENNLLRKEDRINLFKIILYGL